MTIRIDADDKSLITDYAKTFGKTASDFMREAALGRIEDELDLRTWEEAKEEYDKDPVTYSAEEIAAKYR